MMPLLSSYEYHVSLRAPLRQEGPMPPYSSKNALKSVANKGLIDVQEALAAGNLDIRVVHGKHFSAIFGSFSIIWQRN
jgi:hypothetical protein